MSINSHYFIHNDIQWRVIPNKNDQHTKILNRLFNVTHQTFSKTTRIFAIRFDLRVKQFTEDNKVLNIFHKSLTYNLTKKYPKSFINYIWVREQNSSENQHYHYVLMMNANYIRYSQSLIDIIVASWSNTQQGGSVYIPENPWYLIPKDNINKYADFMYRISYLGKKNTKEKNPKGIKQYEARLLSPNSKQQKSLEIKTKVLALPISLSKDKPDTISLEIASWWGDNPDWKTHKKNYYYHKIKSGIKLKTYTKKFNLKHRNAQRNFRKAGGNSLSILHWIYHKYHFLLEQQKSGILLSQYIIKHKLNAKSALIQLRRKRMSEFWSYHYDRYYTYFWKKNWTVADYCRLEGLKPTTARRYLFNFPPAVVNPFEIKEYL